MPAAGDEGAFSLLYGRYARMIHGLLLARVPRLEVDDLVQDVLEAVLRAVRSGSVLECFQSQPIVFIPLAGTDVQFVHTLFGFFRG